MPGSMGSGGGQVQKQGLRNFKIKIGGRVRCWGCRERGAVLCGRGMDTLAISWVWHSKFNVNTQDRKAFAIIHTFFRRSLVVQIQLNTNFINLSFCFSIFFSSSRFFCRSSVNCFFSCPISSCKRRIVFSFSQPCSRNKGKIKLPAYKNLFTVTTMTIKNVTEIVVFKNFIDLTLS